MPQSHESERAELEALLTNFGSELAALVAHHDTDAFMQRLEAALADDPEPQDAVESSEDDLMGWFDAAARDRPLPLTPEQIHERCTRGLERLRREAPHTNCQHDGPRGDRDA